MPFGRGKRRIVVLAVLGAGLVGGYALWPRALLCVPDPAASDFLGGGPYYWLEFRGSQVSGGFSTCHGPAPFHEALLGDGTFATAPWVSGHWRLHQGEAGASSYVTEETAEWRGLDEERVVCRRAPAGLKVARHWIRSFFEQFTFGWGAPEFLGLGFVLGLLASLREAKAANARGVSSAWPTASLALRLGATLASGLAFATPSQGFAPGFALLALGQFLAASALAWRRLDVPTGFTRRSPAWSMLLAMGTAAVLAAPSFEGSAPSSSWVSGRSWVLEATTAWGLFYLCAPVLLHALLPEFARAKLRIAGLGVVLFLAGQSLVGWETTTRLFVVFSASDGHRGSSEAVVMSMGSVVVALAAFVLHVRRAAEDEWQARRSRG